MVVCNMGPQKHQSIILPFVFSVLQHLYSGTSSGGSWHLKALAGFFFLRLWSLFEAVQTFSIYSAPEQGVPQLDTVCCVKIQRFLCFKSCACQFHLILSAPALEEAVNRERGDTSPVLALITPLLYPLSYLLWGLWLLSQSLVVRLYQTCDHPCCPAYCHFQSAVSFQSLWDQSCTQYSRQTNQPFIQWLNNILSLFFIPFLVISNTQFFPVSEQWADSHNCLL